MSLLTADPTRALAGRPGTGTRRHPSDGGRARWERPALVALLVGTGVLYLWGLGASGWANSFYSAAAQAGSESWKAFFFGSSDAANSITVDKTPLSLWPMALSVRIFGLSSWSLLVPQALEGVAAVGLLYATVRRTTGSTAAGLLAGVVLATTPVAVLMFRFDNPDALLTLLLVGSAYAALRAVESVTPPGPLARAGGRTGGAGVPHQDAAGVPGRPRSRPGLPALRAHLVPQAARPPAGRARRDARLGRLVGRDRLALAGEQPPLHRRQPGQLDPRADARLQRLRPAHRQRGRLGRRRWRERRHVGRDRPGTAPERRDRRPDRLAAADRAAAARRPGCGSPAGPRAPIWSGRAW